MTTIFPTRTCFDDSIEFIERHARENPDAVRSGRYVLVHGICLAPDGSHPPLVEGMPFVHAWVEEGDRVWDAGLVNGEKIWYSADRSEWYGALRVQETTSYTVEALYRENVRSGHYGPWLDRYAAMVRHAGPDSD